MRRSLALLVLLALAGCSGRDGNSPLAYSHPRDMLAAAIGRAPCMRKQAGHMIAVGAEHCYRLGKSERFRGVWLDQLGGSVFLDGAKAGKRPPAKGCTWLEVDRGRLPPDYRSTAGSGPLAIEFVGRRTAVRGHYGDGGGCPQLIVVERVTAIHATQVSPLPPANSALS
jgi:hypothetical protein